jgi:hypothetical protein
VAPDVGLVRIGLNINYLCGSEAYYLIEVLQSNSLSVLQEVDGRLRYLSWASQCLPRSAAAVSPRGVA